MSSIDQVIARSRQPGEFAERKRFTVARQRALQKMRKFALAHPAYYIAELIQAAIANGATYVDINVAPKSVVFSYVGGSFTEEQLGQLFDFLFASKEVLQLADVRLLALGVNALLLAEPREVVIESGDGTLAGTTRVQIDAKKSTVEVGTPTQPLSGTYIRATNIKRSVLGYGLLGPKELDVIESRCLAAPVPIFVNNKPIFGYTSQRTPRLFGCDSSISFDEGDLYGTIGVSKFEGESREFKILTWGVWVESVQSELIPGFPLGGIVAFDRLHKSADHSSLVRDERYKEMWVRVLPYARQLKSGQTGKATFDISLSDGTLLSAMHLRQIFKEYSGAVVVPRFKGRLARPRYQRAEAIGEALGLPLLIRGQEHSGTLRLLAGSDARIVVPNVDDAVELEFYRQPPAEPPPRPWLIGAVELEPVTVEAFVDVVERHVLWGIHSELRDGFLAYLGKDTTFRVTIYTPEQVPRGDADLLVEVRSTDRKVWEGSVQSPYPAHVLLVETGNIAPKKLLDAPPGLSLVNEQSWAALIAEGVALLASESLKTATNRVLMGLGRLDVSPGSAGARIALAAIARSAVTRLRTESDGSVRVRFSLFDPELSVLVLDTPLFTSLDGAQRSAHDLEELMAETGGLIYGVVPGVTPDLAGLYAPRILQLDLIQERLLIALVGEASYVRVDRREVLAEHGGIKCRDMALGVRRFTHFPLLAEGDDDLATLTDSEKKLCEEALVNRLVEVFSSTRSDEELRRQAARHLLYYIYFKHTLGEGNQILPVVLNLPLFLDVDGRSRAFLEIEDQLGSAEGLVMHDGWSVDTADLGALERGLTGGDVEGLSNLPCRGLAMNPFVFHVLSRIGKVRPALDIDLSAAEALVNPETPDVAYLAEVRVDDSLVEGVVGVPTVAVEQPVVLVFAPESKGVHVISGPAVELGVVGRLHMKRAMVDGDLEALESIVHRVGVDVHGELIDSLSETEVVSPDYERCVSVILDLASRSVQMIVSPSGRLFVEVLRPEARRALDLPLFPTTAGVAVSAWALLSDWAASFGRGGENEVWSRLDPTAPPAITRWLRGLLSREHVIYPPSHGREQPTVGPMTSSDDAALAEWLTGALDELRPDPVGAHSATKVVIAYEVGDVMRVDELPIFAMDREQLLLFCRLRGEPYLVLNGGHWLVERTRTRAPNDPEAAVWLLLACYGHINDVLEPVTNEHEIVFHQRIIKLLERGGLNAVGRES